MSTLSVTNVFMHCVHCAGTFTHGRCIALISRYVTMGRHMYPSNVPLPLEDQDPHLIHGSLDPRESAPKWHFDRFSHIAQLLFLTYIHGVISPSPPVDSIWAMMIVWRLGGKIIRTVLCCVVFVYNSCAQWYTHLKFACWFRFRFCFVFV